MENDLKSLLEEELKKELANLGSLESGSSKHGSAIDDIAALYKLKIEQEKFDLEEAKEEYKVDLEDEKKSEEKKNRYIQWGIDIAQLVLPLAFYATWMRKGFQFEKDGTFTSTTFRNLFNGFKPKGR